MPQRIDLDCDNSQVDFLVEFDFAHTELAGVRNGVALGKHQTKSATNLGGEISLVFGPVSQSDDTSRST